jgi:hypothetical protein
MSVIKWESEANFSLSLSRLLRRLKNQNVKNLFDFREVSYFIIIDEESKKNLLSVEICIDENILA